MGTPKSAKETIAALIERKSRYILAKKISQLKYTIEAFKALLQPLAAQSLTLDNGVENVRYQKLDLPTYFCHSYSSWEKGSIEYAFKLIREYIPKKAKLTNYPDEEIAAIIDTINNRPRKCLDWQTPYEVFKENCLTENYLPRSTLLTIQCCASG